MLGRRMSRGKTAEPLARLASFECVRLPVLSSRSGEEILGFDESSRYNAF